MRHFDGCYHRDSATNPHSIISPKINHLSKGMDISYISSELAYARAAMLEDHCDDMRKLAADLREAAEILTYRAYDLQQAAFVQRKRSAELSGHWSSGPATTSEIEEKAIEKEISEVSRFEYHGREVRYHLNALHVGSDDEETSHNLLESRSTVTKSDARVQAAVSKVVGRFKARISRLLYDHKNEGDKKPQPLHRAVNPNGSPYYEDDLIQATYQHPRTNWIAVNDNHLNKKAKHYGSSSDMDDSTAAGLMQYTDRQDWKSGELILRKADNLQRNRRAERKLD